MNAVEKLVRCLENEGVTEVSGIPGDASMKLTGKLGKLVCPV